MLASLCYSEVPENATGGVYWIQARIALRRKVAQKAAAGAFFL
jgi:hypothetical protein